MYFRNSFSRLLCTISLSFSWFYCFSMNLIKIHVWNISLKNPRSRIINKIIKVTRLIFRTLCIIFYEFLCSIDKNTKNTFSNGLRWFFTLSCIQRESLNYRGKSSVASRQGQSANKQTEGLSELLVYRFTRENMHTCFEIPRRLVKQATKRSPFWRKR